MARRFMFGDRVFVPTGSTKVLAGARGGLARVQELGEAKGITLFVGLKKGLKSANQTGRCAKKRKKFSVRAVDNAVIRGRALQVGRKSVDLTRTEGRGVFEGQREKSVAYQIAYIPNDAEPTFPAFKRNIDRLAEEIAAEFCQDSVLIVRDDGDKRTVAETVWWEE